MQFGISKVLGIPENVIHLSTKRIGGAFGAKISRNNMVTPIAALAAFKLNARVRLVLSLSDNMKIVGKRPEYMFSYAASLDGQNKEWSIQKTSLILIFCTQFPLPGFP